MEELNTYLSNNYQPKAENRILLVKEKLSPNVILGRLA